MEDRLLTPQEVADILKVRKNTVYFMIKRGELPATKLGKQLRIREEDVNAIFQPGGLAVGDSAASREPQQPSPMVPTLYFSNDAPMPLFGGMSDGRPLILSGQDILLDMICDKINNNQYGAQMLRTYLGSYNGLYAMYQEQVTAATCHLWDAETDTYNLPFVQKLLLGEEIHLFHLCNRMQGYYVAKGNPKNLSSFEDLRRQDVVFLNREKGSGTRVLLDGMLRRMGIAPQSLQGYDRMVNSHLVAASTVAKGGADFALGNERAAYQVANVDFIPLKSECYDLVIRKRDMHLPLIQRLLDVIRSPFFAEEIAQIKGYDITNMGAQLL